MSKMKTSILKIFISFLLYIPFTVRAQDRCAPEDGLAEIHFKKNSVFLTNSAKKILDSIALVTIAHKNCRLLVGSSGSSSEEEQQLSWDKTYSTIKYLKQKGVDSTKFIFFYGGDDDLSIVYLRFIPDDTEQPFYMPAPHPCYSYHRLTKKRCKNLHR